MVIYRKCPVCGNKLSFIDVLKPAFQAIGKPIVCSHCNHTISESWSRYSWLPALGMGLGLLMSGWTALVALLVSAIIIMYLFIPLKRID